MRTWVRRWVSEWRARSPAAPRTAFIVGAATVVTTAMWLLVREAFVGLVSQNAIAALLNGPLWLRILVGGMLLIGVVAAAVSLIQRRYRPRPDNSSEPVGDAPGLPPAPPTFVGREQDLAVVVGLLDTERVVAVIGRRAVGTSALAVHAAHRIANRFPDGSFYLDLRGLDTERELNGDRALQRVLQLLGLVEPRSHRPDDLDEAADRLHTWLAKRQALLLLNNVDRPEQVRRLLPVGPGCRVLLAGSVDLEELAGPRVHHLSELSESAAVALLAACSTPELVERDPSAAVELVNQCGRQPLAIRLLAQLLRDRGWPLRRVVEVVHEAMRVSPYRQWRVESAALRRVWDACDLTYREMSVAHRRLFRLLTLIPTIEIGTHAAGAVAGLPADQAAALLEELVRRGLVESASPGRYRVRQLLATSALRRLEHEESRRQLARARLRIARYYAVLSEQYAEPLLVGPVRAGRSHEHDAAIDESRRWFEHEHDVLFRLVTTQLQTMLPRRRSGTARRSDPVEAWLWRVAVALCIWYAREGRLDDRQLVVQAVLKLPMTTKKAAIAFWVHNELGVVHRLRAETREAWQEFQLAARFAGGSRGRGLSQAQTNLGLVLIDQGQFDAAVRHLELGLALRSRTDRNGRAISALGLGTAHLRAGDLDTARHQLSRAANAFELLHDETGLAASLNALGVVLWEQDDRLGAAEHWELCRERYVDSGDDVGLAGVLLNVAADRIRTRPDQAAVAADLLSESLRLRAGYPRTHGTGLAYLHLGDAVALCHDADRARQHWQEALRILKPLGGPEVIEAEQRLNQEVIPDEANQGPSTRPAQSDLWAKKAL